MTTTEQGKKVQVHQNPDEVLAKIREGFEQMKAQPVATNRKIIAELAGEIRALLAEGYTQSQILQVLASNNVDLKPSTLRYYLGEAPKEEPLPARRKASSGAKAEATPARAARGAKNKGKAEAEKKETAKPAPEGAPTDGSFRVEADPEEV